MCAAPLGPPVLSALIRPCLLSVPEPVSGKRTADAGAQPGALRSRPKFVHNNVLIASTPLTSQTTHTSSSCGGLIEWLGATGLEGYVCFWYVTPAVILEQRPRSTSLPPSLQDLADGQRLLMTDSDDDASADDESPINEEWLEEVLACYHRQQLFPECASQTIHTNKCPKQQLCVKVGDFSIRPGCALGESVLSDIVAVGVDYKLLCAVERGREAEETAHSLSLVVKLLPNDPFSRLFVTEAQFDLREINFYTKVVPDLEKLVEADEPLPIPRCYYARYEAATDTSAPESLLVLDNLKAQGYNSQSFSVGLNLQQARAALQSVAKLHALSLVLKIKDGQPLSERYPFLFQTERATDSYQQLVERGLPHLTAFLERQPTMSGVQKAIETLRPTTKDVIANLLSPKEPMALITHTDFWCNNLLFKDDDCAVLDWQMVTYSRPTNDLALLLLSSLPTSLRRENSKELVDIYWRVFTTTASNLGVDIEVDLHYSRAMLDADLKRSKLLAILLCIGSVDVAIGDPQTEERLVDVLNDLLEEGVLAPPDDNDV